MKFLMIALMFLAPAVSLAGETCENYAKYFAIRDYKVTTGEVQGSEGLQYEAELISVDQYPEGDEYLYKVTVFDNNEDGDTWAVDYDVNLRHIKATNKCALLKLKSEARED